MSIADALVAEFDQEMQSTRRLLELVPADKAGWKPDPKSWNLGDLSVHVANLPVWAVSTLQQTELDMNPTDGPGYTPPSYDSPTATLASFDENVKNARAAIAGASDQDMTVSWSLKNAGESIFTMPRAAVLRSFVFNHMIHHRGQLTVYLRMNDVPLPSTYGPTADSPM